MFLQDEYLTNAMSFFEKTDNVTDDFRINRWIFFRKIVIINVNKIMWGGISMNATKVSSICKKVAEQYRKVYGSALVFVILYGSYARNEQQDDSDLDIAAIVKGERIELQKKLQDVWRVTNKLSIEEDILISATVIPFDEFIYYKEKLPYYGNIEKEGIKIA